MRDAALLGQWLLLREALLRIGLLWEVRSLRVALRNTERKGTKGSTATLGEMYCIRKATRELSYLESADLLDALGHGLLRKILLQAKSVIGSTVCTPVFRLDYFSITFDLGR